MSNTFRTICFHCGMEGLTESQRLDFQIMDVETSRKFKTVSCLPCTNDKELKITMNGLSLASGIPFEKFKNYPCITESFSAFSEDIPDSEKKCMLIGLTDLHRCNICEDYIELKKTVADHNTERHSNEKIFLCNPGCSAYYKESDKRKHLLNCRIVCPVCSPGSPVPVYVRDYAHFDQLDHVGRFAFCPVIGCTIFFRIKKNEHEDDENGINAYLKHLMDYHIWQRVV